MKIGCRCISEFLTGRTSVSAHQLSENPSLFIERKLISFVLVNANLLTTRHVQEAWCLYLHKLQNITNLAYKLKMNKTMVSNKHTSIKDKGSHVASICAGIWRLSPLSTHVIWHDLTAKLLAKVQVYNNVRVTSPSQCNTTATSHCLRLLRKQTTVGIK